MLIFFFEKICVLWKVSVIKWCLHNTTRNICPTATALVLCGDKFYTFTNISWNASWSTWLRNILHEKDSFNLGTKTQITLRFVSFYLLITFIVLKKKVHAKLVDHSIKIHAQLLEYVKKLFLQNSNHQNALYRSWSTTKPDMDFLLVIKQIFCRQFL